MVNFWLIFVALGHSFLGCWKHPTQYLHMHWKGWKLANPHPHHLMCVCEIVKDGMGLHVLGAKVQQNNIDTINQCSHQCPWI